MLFSSYPFGNKYIICTEINFGIISFFRLFVNRLGDNQNRIIKTLFKKLLAASTWECNLIQEIFFNNLFIILYNCDAMLKMIREDIKNVFLKDPAARSKIEVIFSYPGLHAIILHRLAHKLWKNKFHFTARFVSHISRFATGIEIHPGAKIGRRVFIDHGMGVVIGETTEIGNDVLIYKGVLLGGTTLEKKKRHPTIGDNAVLGSNAILLGAIKIGKNARVAAASVVTHDVPENATAIGIPARISLGHTEEEVRKLEHAKLPDPISEAMKFVIEEQKKMEQKMADRIKILEEKLKSISNSNKEK